MIKYFHLFTILVLFSAFIDQLPISDRTSVFLGVVSTLALVPYFLMGLKLAKQGKSRLVIWSFLSTIHMGILATPFAILSIIYAKREIKNGGTLAIIPALIYFLSLIVQIIGLFTLGYVFLS